MDRYLVDVGRALEILNRALDTELFEDLSKHSRKWNVYDDDLTNDREAAIRIADTLDTVRCQLSTLQEEVNNALYLLKGENE